MAISLTRKTCFTMSGRKVNPSDYKTNVRRITGLFFFPSPKFIENNITTNRISNRHRRVCILENIFFPVRVVQNKKEKKKLK